MQRRRDPPPGGRQHWRPLAPAPPHAERRVLAHLSARAASALRRQGPGAAPTRYAGDDLEGGGLAGSSDGGGSSDSEGDEDFQGGGEEEESESDGSGGDDSEGDAQIVEEEVSWWHQPGSASLAAPAGQRQVWSQQ